MLWVLDVKSVFCFKQEIGLLHYDFSSSSVFPPAVRGRVLPSIISSSALTAAATPSCHITSLLQIFISYIRLEIIESAVGTTVLCFSRVQISLDLQ